MSAPLEWLRLGGPAMIVLLAMSVVALTLVIVKLWEFWELQLSRRTFVARAIDAWQRRQADQALAVLGAEVSPLAEVMAVAMRSARDPALSEAQAREQVERYAADRLERLRGLFRPLEVIAQLAPLLGLLGTVLGMIEAFQRLEIAGERVDPAVLSGGIWQALLTTAAGLTIAIPTIAVLSALERQVERLHHDMETALTRIFTPPSAATVQPAVQAADAAPVGRAY